jgi:hypothetical protein
MITGAIDFKLTEKTHCLAILPIDKHGAGGPETLIHPIVCTANEDGYNVLYSAVWKRGEAQRLVDQYNRDVLGLTPAQAEGIFSSTMFPCSYPDNVKGLEPYYQMWESERLADV